MLKKTLLVTIAMILFWYIQYPYIPALYLNKLLKVVIEERLEIDQMYSYEYT